MKRAALAVLAAMLASAPAIADVPSTISFSARLVDEDSGKAVTGAHQIKFALFTAETGGTSVWDEGREVMIDDGVLFTSLGENRALDATVFDGKNLWLEVTLDNVVMEPRVTIESVPYAFHAATADKVGDVAANNVQQRISGACTSGFITTINTDGSVVCGPDSVGTGDVSAVFAGSGLQGGGNSGDITISLLQTCAAGQILKWSGSAWQCAADGGGTGGGGDITGVLVGSAGGLSGGGATGDVTLSLLSTCAINQVLKWSGSTWACASDVDTDTNSGGDITSVTTAVGTGLQGGITSGDAALSLLTTCASGQVLKWNGAGWGCGNDIDTDTNGGGDITDVIAGNGLTGGAAAGAATVNVVGGTGISVAADLVSLDLAFTDARYVNQTGDTMGGNLDMGGFAVTNRACPAGHVRVAANLCTENQDASSHTFPQCANRCAVQGTHMCTSAEARAIITSGVTLASNMLFDWMDDQVADDTALYVNTATSADNLDGESPVLTSASRYCRCCANLE